MASPSAAPRPWPTCSGPVGLAETNSTLTLSPAPVGAAAVGGALREDRAVGVGQLVCGQPEVDEARARDLGPRDQARARGAAPRAPARRSSAGWRARAWRAPWRGWWRGRRGRRRAGARARTRRRRRRAARPPSPARREARRSLGGGLLRGLGVGLGCGSASPWLAGLAPASALACGSDLASARRLLRLRPCADPCRPCRSR